eukprot:scaffold92104_cov36-Phaeocystis_antarctica.AAC.1
MGGAAAQRPRAAVGSRGGCSARWQHQRQLVVRRGLPGRVRRRHSRPRWDCCQPDRALRAYAVRVALSATKPAVAVATASVA